MNRRILISPDQSSGFKPILYGNIEPHPAPLKISAVAKDIWHFTTVALWLTVGDLFGF
ncbi:hypothetical protein QUB60_18430 [Microcoleus sp. A2-C5]|uniref:hypothetical protein n=1 Tax=unclassified Microcoleus TaxID=2642155 RepID=UPI002FD6E213